MADWLDIEPAAPEVAAPVIVAPSKEDDWLNITDPNAGKVSLSFQHLIDSCMRGTNRVMACDGHYWAYRPFNREFDKEVNPRTRERFADFIASGCQKFIGTYDEVQIWELLEGSPFRHDKKGYVVGKDRWADIRQAARAACERRWSDYHDLMGTIAAALKSGRDAAFARMMWEDTCNQVAVTIQQMKGPTEAEVNAGFTGVRKARGISKGGVIATLNTSGLQKAQFR